MKTIICLFHPDLAHSQINKALAHSATAAGFELRDLYHLYPDFNIDVAREHDGLSAADRIVLQFPIYWYSSPALLKEWQDRVFTPGWAYAGGAALRGKELLLAVSTETDAANYQHDGTVGYTLNKLLAPFQATSHFLGMHYLAPFATFGAANMDHETLAKQSQAYLKRLRS